MTDDSRRCLAQTYTEYVFGMLADEDDGDLDDRVEGAIGALGAAVEDEAALEALRTELAARWRQHEAESREAAAAAADAKKEATMAEAERVRAELAAEAEAKRKEDQERCVGRQVGVVCGAPCMRTASSRQWEYRRMCSTSKHRRAPLCARASVLAVCSRACCVLPCLLCVCPCLLCVPVLAGTHGRRTRHGAHGIG